MRYFLLTLILFFCVEVFSQCKTSGFYYHYGIGTVNRGGSSLKMEFGYPKLTSPFFMTGILDMTDLNSRLSFFSYGIQFNHKVHVGNNDFIQFVNFLNSRESHSSRKTMGNTLGLRWLQRLKRDSNSFFVATTEYRQFDLIEPNNRKYGSVQSVNDCFIGTLGISVVF